MPQNVTNVLNCTGLILLGHMTLKLFIVGENTFGWNYTRKHVVLKLLAGQPKEKQNNISENFRKNYYWAIFEYVMFKFYSFLKLAI